MREAPMDPAKQPVNFTQLRDKRLRGANDPGGTRLSVYESHYLLQLIDNLATHSSDGP
jgi:hypothetical protein